MCCDTPRERVASYLLLQWAMCAYVRAWGEAYTRDAQWRRRRFIRQRLSLPSIPERYSLTAAPEHRSPARWRALVCRRALIGPITHFLIDYNSVIMHFIAKWKTYVVLRIPRSIWLRRVPGTFSEHPVYNQILCLVVYYITKLSVVLESRHVWMFCHRLFSHVWRRGKCSFELIVEFYWCWFWVSACSCHS